MYGNNPSLIDRSSLLRKRSRLIAALIVLLLAALAGSAAAQPASADAVYVMSNAAAGNAILVFDRAVDGTLNPAGSFPTGGAGTGGGLGSQGALIISEDGQYLFTVNAGSDEITSFRLDSGTPVFADKIASNGDLPISLTYHRRRLVVLNAGGSGNLSTFRVRPNGTLAHVPGSTRPLSNGGVGPAPGPAQVEFAPNGSQLIVAEKASNLLLTYPIAGFNLGAPTTHASAGMTPFGFGFGNRNLLIVSEAFGGAPNASAVSSYQVGQGSLQPITPSAPTNQTAACWIVVTGNGRYTYTTNTGSGSVSGYAIAADGSLTLLDADGRTGVTGDGSSPIDAALDHDSNFLYVLNAGAHTVTAFRVHGDGSLTNLGDVAVPTGSVGIAAH